MTFEDFFAKKKIDLGQLEKADPALFSEFKSHFTLMGEKSFDHTKKFWFNKLRRLYHLETAGKALTQVETKIASQAEPLSSPTIEQQALPEIVEAKPAAVPRFKPRNIPAKAAEDSSTKSSDAEAPAPVAKQPVGFKPRSIKAVENTTTADANSAESRPGNLDSSNTPVTNPGEVQEVAKLGFKPKFKPRNIPHDPGGVAEQKPQTTEEKLIPEVPEEAKAIAADDIPVSEETVKPAYKPRFKMKNLPQKPDEPEEGTTGASRTESNEDSVTDKSETPEEPAKPAYKPRFNMKNLPQKPAAEPVSSAEAKNEEIEPTEAAQEAPATAEDAPKPAYKPRFNMKNIPKKTADEGDNQEKKKEIPPAETLNEPASTEAKPTEASPSESSKPAYKPRFNMKNIKPRNEGDQ